MDQNEQAKASISARHQILGGAKVLDKADRDVHVDTDLLDNLTDILKSNGEVKIVMNRDGLIDVRAGGMAAYHPQLRAALRMRIQLEVNRVTNTIGAEVGNQTMGASSDPAIRR